jgi:hypothetical protein
VFRSNTAAPATRADFEGEGGCATSAHPATCDGLGGPGLGDPASRRIFDGKALTLGAAPAAVYVTLGNSDDPVRVFRLTP